MVKRLPSSPVLTRLIAIFLAGCLTAEPATAAILQGISFSAPATSAGSLSLFRQEALVGRLPTDMIQAFSTTLFNRAILTPAVSYVRRALKLPRRLSRSKVLQYATSPKTLAAVAGIAGVLKSVTASAEKATTVTAGIAHQSIASAQAHFTTVDITSGKRLWDILKAHNIPTTQANLDTIQQFNELLGTDAVRTIGEQAHLLIAGKNLVLPFDPIAAPTTVIKEVVVTFAAPARPDLLPTLSDPSFFLSPETWLTAVSFLVGIVLVTTSYLLIRNFIRNGRKAAMIQLLSRGRSKALSAGTWFLGTARLVGLNARSLIEALRRRPDPIAPPKPSVQVREVVEPIVPEIPLMDPAPVTTLPTQRPVQVPAVEEPADRLNLTMTLAGEPEPASGRKNGRPRKLPKTDRPRLAMEADDSVMRLSLAGEPVPVTETTKVSQRRRSAIKTPPRLTLEADKRLNRLKYEWRLISHATYKTRAEAQAARDQFINEELKPLLTREKNREVELGKATAWGKFLRSVPEYSVVPAAVEKAGYTLVLHPRPVARRIQAQPEVTAPALTSTLPIEAATLGDFLRNVITPFAARVKNGEGSLEQWRADLERIKTSPHAQKGVGALQVKGLEALLAAPHSAPTVEATPTPVAESVAPGVSPAQPAIETPTDSTEERVDVERTFTSLKAYKNATGVKEDEKKSNRFDRPWGSRPLFLGILGSAVTATLVWVAQPLLASSQLLISPTTFALGAGGVLALVSGTYGLVRYMNRESPSKEQIIKRDFEKLLGKPTLQTVAPRVTRGATPPSTPKPAPGTAPVPQERVMTASSIPLPKKAVRTPEGIRKDLQAQLAKILAPLADAQLPQRALNANNYEAAETNLNELLRTSGLADVTKERAQATQALAAFRDRMGSDQQAILDRRIKERVAAAARALAPKKPVAPKKATRSVGQLIDALEGLKTRIESDALPSLENFSDYLQEWKAIQSDGGFDKENVPLYRKYVHIGSLINKFNEDFKVDGKTQATSSALMGYLREAAVFLRSVNISADYDTAAAQAEVNELILVAQSRGLIDETRAERLKKNALNDLDKKHPVVQALNNIRLALQVVQTFQEATRRGAFDPAQTDNSGLAQRYINDFNEHRTVIEKSFMSIWPGQQARLMTTLEEQAQRLEDVRAAEKTVSQPDIRVPQYSPNLTPTMGGRSPHQMPAAPMAQKVLGIALVAALGGLGGIGPTDETRGSDPASSSLKSPRSGFFSEKGSASYLITGVFTLGTIPFMLVGAYSENPGQTVLTGLSWILGVGVLALSALLARAVYSRYQLRKTAVGLAVVKVAKPGYTTTQPRVIRAEPLIQRVSLASPSTEPQGMPRAKGAIPAKPSKLPVTDAGFWPQFERFVAQLEAPQARKKWTSYFAFRAAVNQWIGAQSRSGKLTDADKLKAEQRRNLLLATFLKQVLEDPGLGDVATRILKGLEGEGTHEQALKAARDLVLAPEPTVMAEEGPLALDEDSAPAQDTTPRAKILGFAKSVKEPLAVIFPVYWVFPASVTAPLSTLVALLGAAWFVGKFFTPRNSHPKSTPLSTFRKYQAAA